MTEEEFRKLLIEVVRQSDYTQKNELIELLRESDVSFDKTSEYTRSKWDHYKEYIYIITTPTNLPSLMKHQKYIKQVVGEIYPVGEDYMYELFGVEIKPGKVSNNEIVSQEIHFEGIQNQIIEEIRAAKYTIWIAMAWFTNKTIFDELLKKKQQGINIQVVIDDNEKNHNAVFRLEDYFETHKVSVRSLYPNLMHDKFCIIDLHKVIHGTFNWTNAANYNKETISIDDNSTTARAFADEFMKLKMLD